eukprot:TRINITY_DN41212_c0_g1_i1.p1 TRINITY_DN41212_c0_g1~~TRINITY_DN41212_c0_g1_i1.p1  ORF type:complete len:493 (+),score=59.52 TRINITY_DN41212_c0_g1_i1:34-1512(+)
MDVVRSQHQQQKLERLTDAFADHMQAIVPDPDSFVNLSAMLDYCYDKRTVDVPFYVRAPFQYHPKQVPGLDNGSEAGLTYVLNESLHFRASVLQDGGHGWVAQADLEAGVTVLMEKPVASYLASELREPSEERARLSVELAEALRKKGKPLSSCLARLHPPQHLADEMEMDIDPRYLADMSKAWSMVKSISKAQRHRLELALALNVFCFATNDEQLCFSRQFGSLSGAGLYLLGAGFNHSCEPNMCRWSVGDVLVFRTIRKVMAGEELYFSYLSPEQLRSKVKLRARGLDFRCSCIRCQRERSDRTSQKRKHQESACASVPTCSLGDDRAVQKNIVAAVVAMVDGNFAQAAQLWLGQASAVVRGGVAFDDALFRYVLQAVLSLAASRGGDQERLDDQALKWLGICLEVHRVVFGEGTCLFQQRFSYEIKADLAEIWLGKCFRIANRPAWSQLQMAQQLLIQELHAQDEREMTREGVLQVMSWAEVCKTILDL